MNIDPQIIIFIVSLGAIFALAGTVKWLGLGRTPRLTDEESARSAANEVRDGFIAERVSLDQNGTGALLSDENGQIMVIKQHGNFFAGRLLGPDATAIESKGKLIVDCGEVRFGRVTLSLANAQTWADAIDRLKTDDHA